MRHVPECIFGDSVLDDSSDESMDEWLSDETEVSLSNVAEHQASNSLTFHRNFSNLITIGDHDGLIFDITTHRPYGAVRLRSHNNLCPSTYRSDGMWRPGTPKNLIQVLEALPGLRAEWSDVQDRSSLLRNLFLDTVNQEMALHYDLSRLSERLLGVLSLAQAELRMTHQVPTGVYGIAAYSIREEQAKPIYSPMTAAYIGNTDCVFKFGEGSRDLEGKSVVAVVVNKLISPRDVSDYNRHNDALCAEIHSSFLGCEARVGIIIRNGMFKLFWREIIDNLTYLYTYPAGTVMADFARVTEQLVFSEVMFHVVRCSVRLGTEIWNPIPYKAPREPPVSWGSGGGQGPVIKVMQMDGSIKEVAPFEFQGWSEAQLNLLSQYLKMEKKWVNSQASGM